MQPTIGFYYAAERRKLQVIFAGLLYHMYAMLHC